MTKKIKTVLTIAVMVFASHFSFAGATEDLWTALKGANYPNALSAIAAGADVKNLDASFGTPLNFASCWADANVVKALIDAKSEVNFVAPANGFTPLINAAYWGNVEAVKLLLAAGADITIKSKTGQSILSIVVVACKLEVIKLLVAAGADPKEKYSMGALKNLTLLNTLVMGNEPEDLIKYYKGLVTPMANLAVTFPPHILNAQSSDFNTLEEITVYLLDKGLDPNQEVRKGYGILMQFLDFGKTGAAKALIEHGATAEFDEKNGFDIKDKRGDASKLPNFRFSNGDYVLAAVLTNNFEFVKLMVDKYPKLIKKIYKGSGTVKCSGASTNYEAKGINLLMVAADNGNIDIVNYLISKGAGRGDAVEIKQFKQDKFCPMFSTMFTMGFARNSGNQQVIDAVKASGFGKEK